MAPKNRTIFTHQLKYATKVFYRFSDSIAIPVEQNAKPFVSNSPSREAEKETTKDIPYAVGSIMYLIVGTRPDTALYMREFSQFLAHPGMEH